jgi:prepilin-type N-terminal cleavage/methylation domain-containing protein
VLEVNQNTCANNNDVVYLKHNQYYKGASVMILNNKLTQKDYGFTIVELLVVIVVIGILAAITLVSYSGITARANTSSAQSSANAVISKAANYSTDYTTAQYPATLAALTGAASTTSYYLSGVTYGALGAQPGSPSVVQFQACGHKSLVAAPANYGEITTYTGVKIGYWDYSAAAVAYYYAGVTSGVVGTYGVACFASGS